MLKNVKKGKRLKNVKKCEEILKSVKMFKIQKCDGWTDGPTDSARCSRVHATKNDQFFTDLTEIASKNGSLAACNLNCQK